MKIFWFVLHLMHSGVSFHRNQNLGVESKMTLKIYVLSLLFLGSRPTSFIYTARAPLFIHLFITSAIAKAEILFPIVFVCLSMYKISQEQLDEFRWNFTGGLAWWLKRILDYFLFTLLYDLWLSPLTERPWLPFKL